MSWRDILGIEASNTHNSHNTQNTPINGISADIANCAEQESKLLESLNGICQHLDISASEVKNALSNDEIASLANGDETTESLNTFAIMLAQRKRMDQGKRPESYKHIANCQHCGPVWLWFSGDVLGCPWCWNHAQGNPIPRPGPVRCADCKHFERVNHPRLGHCKKGQAETPAGLWASDNRYCDYFCPS